MEIREGLLPEQTVAVRGAAFLNDGDLVQISAEGSAASSVNTLPVAR